MKVPPPPQAAYPASHRLGESYCLQLFQQDVTTVLSLSLFVTQLATIALTYTGLSLEAARFQARSAFTGTGFTTSEAENVVDHPVRRSTP